jgi:hypothetical protein
MELAYFKMSLISRDTGGTGTWFRVGARYFTLFHSAGPAVRSSEPRIPSVDIWGLSVRGAQPTTLFHQMLTPRIHEAVITRPRTS